MKNFVFQIDSVKDFSETVEMAIEIITSYKFSVLHTHDVQGVFAKKGIEHGPYKIIEFCRGPSAKKMLDINPEIGLFLPCKVVVCERKSKVILYILRPNFIHDFFPNEELGDIPEKVDQDIALIAKAFEEKMQ
jgi:uncharacterized protein (DUF302 family)